MSMQIIHSSKNSSGKPRQTLESGKSGSGKSIQILDSAKKTLKYVNADTWLRYEQLAARTHTLYSKQDLDL